MSDIVKKDPPTIDNFAGWEDGVEGDDRPEGAGVIQGIKLRFSNQAEWLQRDDETMPPDLELVAVDVGRYVQKWSEDGPPLETIHLEAHQKFPDIEKMNEETPKEEWVEGPDEQKRGPWQSSHVLYLLNTASMDRFSYPTSTVGGRIAIRNCATN
jgi:hypothetical protein